MKKLELVSIAQTRISDTDENLGDLTKLLINELTN